MGKRDDREIATLAVLNKTTKESERLAEPSLSLRESRALRPGEGEVLNELRGEWKTNLRRSLPVA